MKLDVRKTMLVGLGFLSICAFWQLYDFVIPLILKDTFLIDDFPAGWVMSMDNVLALFMLPLFGRFSDKCDTRIGRRMPYVIFGTVAAVILMNLIPLVSGPGARIIERVYTGSADAGMLGAPLSRVFWIFFAVLMLLLVAMGTYRSPAVALMPDITPKPLRSRANAIINLMGTLGGIVTLACIQLFARTRKIAVLPQYATGADGTYAFTNFAPLFIAVAAAMAIAVAAMALTVRERKVRLPADPEAERAEGAGAKLSRPMRRSLLLILSSVFFWFMGYNAVTTAYSKYFVKMWGDMGGAALSMTIATGGAVAAYIPVGMLSARFGRKRMILAGVALLAACFAGMACFKEFSGLIYVLFVLVGFAWAAINVNSYPMVVEISRAGDVGKYTGYYYTFSMAAQIATPPLSGFLLQHVGYHTLFPYAAVMVVVSFITMLFVKHGDARPARAEKLIDSFAGDD